MKKKINNRGKQTGWETNKINGNYLEIIFSMSSQLWITVNSKILTNYLFAKVKINNNTNKIDFSDLYDINQ